MDNNSQKINIEKQSQHILEELCQILESESLTLKEIDFLDKEVFELYSLQNDQDCKSIQTQNNLVKNFIIDDRLALMKDQFYGHDQSLGNQNNLYQALKQDLQICEKFIQVDSKKIHQVWAAQKNQQQTNFLKQNFQKYSQIIETLNRLISSYEQILNYRITQSQEQLHQMLNEYFYKTLSRLILSPQHSNLIQQKHINLFQDFIFLNFLMKKQLEQNSLHIQIFLQKSLRLLGIICLKQRKCSTSWHLRYKILVLKINQFIEEKDNQEIQNHIVNILEDEIRFCSKCNKYEERNYYQWWYRKQIQNIISDLNHYFTSNDEFQIQIKSKFEDLIKLDLELVSQWQQIRPKDPSAFFYLGLKFEN